MTNWQDARARYSNPGKNKGRMVVVRIAERLPRGARYLELSGGGLSAEAVRGVRDDIEIVSADIDRELWPDLRAHARAFRYTALCGSFTQADGQFDLIYLDLTNSTGRRDDSASIRLVHQATKMLKPDGWLVVTITPDHELDSAVSLNRPVTVVSLLAAESKMRAVGAMRYPNGDGKRVTLAVFRGAVRSMENRWRYVLDVYKLDADMKRRNFWICGDMDRGGYGFMFGSNSQRWRADPKNADRARAQDRASRTRQYAKHKARMATDPEYAEAHRAKVRAYRHTESGRAASTAAHRRWREKNRDAWNEMARVWYRRRKLTAVSGTAAEAVSSEEAA